MLGRSTYRTCHSITPIRRQTGTKANIGNDIMTIKLKIKLHDDIAAVEASVGSPYDVFNDDSTDTIQNLP